MKTKATLWCVVLAVLFSIGAASPAHAQRATRIYGSAYQQWWTGWMFSYSPYARVYISDDYGNRWWADTNSRSNWWLDGMPSNRSYNFQAQSKSYPYPWSSVTRIYVSERGWWQSNQTQVPDLICR